MRIVRTLTAVVASGALAFGVTACGEGNNPGGGETTGTENSPAATNGAGTESTQGGDNTSGEGLKVGISMPQKTSENWVEAEGYFNDICKTKKLECTVQFANAGVPEQQQQIDAMITSGAQVLIIGAIDGASLTTQLDKAKEQNIPVIAYDRLLMNTDVVNNYVAYDSFDVGVKQGEALLQGLSEKKGSGPWKIELVAGSNDDANSAKFFDGAMSVLQPKIEDNTLTIPSGQNSQAQAATQGWDPKNAQQRMDSILTQNYPGDEAPDGILSPNDTLARAVLTSAEQAGKAQPVVTGQDSEVESLKWIMQDKQYSTISKPTQPLVENSLDLAIKLADGGEVTELNGMQVNTDAFDNGTKKVPSFLLEPIVATKDNAKEVYANEPSKLKAVESA